jgi:tetratricopeptide (TPR) repeat protein
MMKNLFGESYLVRKSSRKAKWFRGLLALVIAIVLSACATTSPTPPQDQEVESRVREPARQDSEGIQVFPLQNPAVKELLADAGTAEQSGDYGQAATYLERALRIQPRDPEILQSMAEVQLQIQDYEQALNFASRSYDIGPRVGEICSRNWRTISVSREHLGDHPGSAEAEKKATVCMNTKPRGF